MELEDASPRGAQGEERLMTPRERVQRCFARKEPDRVPINYSANPGIDARLKAHYGLPPDDGEGLLRALGVDFRGANPPYRGPKLHPVPPDRRVDLWGAHSRWIEHETGGYWDFCDFPLAEATVADVESFPLPSPDDYDYGAAARACEGHGDYCVVTGGAGYPDIINSTGRVRSMEQVLVDLITGDPTSFVYIDRRIEIVLEVLTRTLDACQGRIDVLALGEDLGTQIGPMISLDLFRSVFRPRIQRFVDLARRYSIPTMIHCCGSSSWAFSDFIDMGIDVVDTLQPEAKDMSPAHLKETYGEGLAFHGCISTAGPVATGTVDEAKEDVRSTLRIMMPGGGYALSPTHQLQDNSPTENVVAMYDAARELGVYR